MNSSEISKIKWQALEYIQKERSVDWYWTVGVISIIACIIAIWTKNYIFAIFVLISGASLALFSIRSPREMEISIDEDSLTIGPDKFEWKRIKSFNIKKGEETSKLIVETNKHFLPKYTIPFPKEMTDEIFKTLTTLEVEHDTDLDEYHSAMFMEKIGL